MENLKEHGLFIVKTGWIVIKKIILYLLLGCFLNLLFLILLGPEMSSLANPVTMHPHEIVGAIIALFFLVITNLHIVGILVLFGVVFPIAYFVAGKKSGVEGAIQKVVAEKQTVFINYAGQKIARFILTNQKWMARAKEIGLQNSVVEFFQSGIRKVNDLPRAVRWILQLLLKKVEKVASFSQTIETHFAGTTPETLADKISTFLSQLINQYMADRKSGAFIWIIGINATLFVLLKVLV